MRCVRRRRNDPWVAGALLLGALTAACGSRGHAVATQPSLLRSVPGVTVARVAGEAVTADEVRAVAQAEGIADVHVALERTITLRLMAREAVRRGLDRDPLVQDLARHAAMQSLLAHTVEQQVRLDNLPESDLASGMRIRGFSLSHGELWHTQHALVTVPANATPAQRAALRARAESVRSALLALPMPRVEQFNATATAALVGVPSRLEDLPAFDHDGRYAAGEMVAPFTHAATALEHPGDVSDVVETPFGYHVIMLVDRPPALDRPESEVRAAVAEELLWRLRHHALEALLEQLRGQYHTAVRSEALEGVTRIPLASPNEQRGGS